MEKTAYMGSAWHEVISDSACYAIIAFLRNKPITSKLEFRKQLPLELYDLFEIILDHLQQCGMISVQEDEIKLLQKNFINIFDLKSISKFLPRLNKEATEIAVRNCLEQNGLKNGNFCQFISIPRNKKSLARLQEVMQNLQKELAAIAEEDLPSDDPEKKQYVSIISTEITLKDFI